MNTEINNDDEARHEGWGGTLMVQPTAKRYDVNAEGRDSRVTQTLRYFECGVVLQDGYIPSAYFRGTSVGVGGTHKAHGFDGPVRAATHGEMRAITRGVIGKLLAQYPGSTPFVRRSRHVSLAA